MCLTNFVQGDVNGFWQKCGHLILELGVQNEVECITMNPRDPDQEKLAQYRKIHPHGTIPCLVVEGRQAIIESGAICLYLADVYGKLGPEADKEAFYSWLVYSTATLDEVMEILFVQWVLTDLPDQDADLINKCVLKFNTAAKYLSQCLYGRDYICGNKFTAADCVLGYNIWWALEMKEGLLLKDFPLILDYYKRLQMRSSFQRVFSELF
ncbi:uncharacterized protein LOC127865848 isoform X2 [Dreissena polymorpha]|uniref:uncharacterized protein LOC127865848 isoform X2 n=1 Tax=Dreissena polymorpha TaxID=45954 RepID=UPI0022640292|nr:uncharacterized protein LOC127865848 isoform X2 [Dreissena polymorpha]